MKRYDYEISYNRFACEDQAVLVESSDGSMVRYSDVETMQAENVRLASALNNMLNDYINLEIIEEWTLKTASDELKKANKRRGYEY
jgi:uncharacterized Zn ribbon protein